MVVAGPSLTVNLITRDNGVGLSTDLRLLTDIFTAAGHDVAFVDWTSRSMRHCHVGVFLELWNPRLVPWAVQTVGIFNLEWFPGRWQMALARTGQLWAKSREAHEFYVSRGYRSTLTGFASRDMYQPTVLRENRVLHLKGHSDLKGTETVLEAWRRHPGLPPLTIVAAKPIPDPPPGVEVLPRQSPEEIVRLMNACPIHVCPSRSEGWGHYITEAMSCGAIVVTTDASPMNEHIRPEYGFLLPARPGPAHHMANLHLTDPDPLAAAVAEAAALDGCVRMMMGSAARTACLSRNAAFAATARDLLARLAPVGRTRL